MVVEQYQRRDTAIPRSFVPALPDAVHRLHPRHLPTHGSGCGIAAHRYCMFISLHDGPSFLRSPLPAQCFRDGPFSEPPGANRFGTPEAGHDDETPGAMASPSAPVELHEERNAFGTEGEANGSPGVASVRSTRYTAATLRSTANTPTC